jgi:hypothetical protein
MYLFSFPIGIGPPTASNRVGCAPSGPQLEHTQGTLQVNIIQVIAAARCGNSIQIFESESKGYIIFWYVVHALGKNILLNWTNLKASVTQSLNVVFK